MLAIESEGCSIGVRSVYTSLQYRTRYRYAQCGTGAYLGPCKVKLDYAEDIRHLCLKYSNLK